MSDGARRSVDEMLGFERSIGFRITHEWLEALESYLGRVNLLLTLMPLLFQRANWNDGVFDWLTPNPDQRVLLMSQQGVLKHDLDPQRLAGRDVRVTTRIVRVLRQPKRFLNSAIVIVSGDVISDRTLGRLQSEALVTYTLEPTQLLDEWPLPKHVPWDNDAETHRLSHTVGADEAQAIGRLTGDQQTFHQPELTEADRALGFVIPIAHGASVLCRAVAGTHGMFPGLRAASYDFRLQRSVRQDMPFELLMQRASDGYSVRVDQVLPGETRNDRGYVQFK